MTLKNNQFHFVTKNKHFAVDINKILPDFQSYGMRASWNCKRLVWIGYLKSDHDNNDDNNDDNKDDNKDNNECYFALLPKEIIRYLLFFL